LRRKFREEKVRYIYTLTPHGARLAHEFLEKLSYVYLRNWAA